MRNLALTLALGLASSASACSKANTEVTTHHEAASVAERAAAIAVLAAEQGGARYLVPVSDADVSRGPRAALVTIVVFVDYPEGEATLTALDELLATYPDELRVVIKLRPSRPEAFDARAVLAAQSQARGWSMHEQLRERTKQHDVETFVQMAQDAGVTDLERFEHDRHANPHPELVRQVELAERLGVRRTPVMFVNGAPYGPVNDAAELTKIFATERELARALIDAGARADEVYSSFMFHAALERQTTEHDLLLSAPYDGPALATRTLASGVVSEDIELGSGEPFAEGTLVRFNFSGYSDATGKQVMGSRGEPAQLICTAATRENDAIADAMCDAMLGQKPGGKRRVRIPAAIVERDAPPSRAKIGDLWLTVELVDVADAPVRRGEDAFAGAPLASKTRSDGLQIHDYALGEGVPARARMIVEIHYMMLLEDGTRLDSSHRRVEGLRVTLGEGGVIKGFEAGLEGARVGMLRKLVIPPQLGYGDEAQGKIPASSTLVFLLEIVDVAPAPEPDDVDAGAEVEIR
jgi:FKBP-type peptidyl-prolyl cis-trans isomerase/protein-disulfide isomerase